MIWFTSDHHWCHTNIIKYCGRSFTSTKLMNDTMIDRWNEAVQPKDIVYHLGDFGFFRGRSEVAQDIIMRLHGTIHLLPGSHDKELTKWLTNGMFEPKIVLEPSLLTIRIQLPGLGRSQTIVLCHYAMRHWEESFHGSWQLHGHTHGRLAPQGCQMDVGVDSHDFYPVSLVGVAARLIGIFGKAYPGDVSRV